MASSQWKYSDLQTVCYLVQTNNLNLKLMQSVLQGNLFLTIRRVPEMEIPIAILLLELMRRRSSYKWTYCRLARYFKLNLMTCKCLLHWLNQPDIKEWEKPPKLAQLSLFD